MSRSPRLIAGALACLLFCSGAHASTRHKTHSHRAHALKTVRAVSAPEAPSAGSLLGLGATKDALGLSSNSVLVMDASAPDSAALLDKNATARLPIASITKLMTALVATEALPNMSETLTISEADVDRVKRSSSRLPVGSRLPRSELLHLALMSSENRAASALSRAYPGGQSAFVAAMNAKAQALGMLDTRYVEPTGLSALNVSTARDLAKLIIAAQNNPTIRGYSTDPGGSFAVGSKTVPYLNTNRLVRDIKGGWQIALQKTGYIMEAGHCMVMQALIDGKPIVMVFLDSKGKLDRFEDAGRVRQWLASRKPAMGLVAVQSAPVAASGSAPAF